MVAGALARIRGPVAAFCLGMGVIVGLAGCVETVDEGVTDYRKATINHRSAEGAPTDISKKYALSNTTDFSGNGAIPVTAGRRYYVSLLQAFVGPEARVGGTNWFNEHEQVALVLRVHDSNDRAHPGRLVFFTDDLKLGGQFLNFSNLLTIGPTDYRGGVVTIDVDEVHLRGTTSHIKELLQELVDRYLAEYLSVECTVHGEVIADSEDSAWFFVEGPAVKKENGSTEVHFLGTMKLKTSGELVLHRTATDRYFVVDMLRAGEAEIRAAFVAEFGPFEA